MMWAFLELSEPKAAGECPMNVIRGSVASKLFIASEP
jgi:hypothetical protein